MRQPKLIDYILLTVLALIWASAFFNIKIATYSFGPVTIAFLRVFFGAIPVLLLCYYKNIKIEAFSKDWHWFAMIGFINLVAPFFLIAYGVKSVQSNLAAILMSTTPLSSTVLGHFYTKNEKFNLVKTIGILIGFSGIVFLFSDNLLIDENNFGSALLILLGSTCYVIGGVLTLKISKKKNENVTGSILIWAIIILIPLSKFYRATLAINSKNRLYDISHILRSCSNWCCLVIKI
jgi:drug/metabolite transporter (DMT)-like permease